MTSLIGQVLNNRYRIEALLGQGGFGAVYQATDLNMSASLNVQYSVAIKENLDASSEAQAMGISRQFQREAALLLKLRHASLPRVSDAFFIPGQGQYLVMDLIEGQDLQHILDQGGPLDEAHAVAWMSQVLDALAYLHSQNPPIIHRDLKPANIRITPDGRAVLVDFGIAKLYDPRLLTTSGARAVTPGYSPWEQYGQGGTDARSDVYAAGATLYTLLTGQQPPESIALMGGAAQLLPPRQLNSRLSPQIEAVILKAMTTHPTDRYSDGGQMRAALQPATYPLPTDLAQPEIAARSTKPKNKPALTQRMDQPSDRRMPNWIWGAAVLLLILLVSGGVWLSQVLRSSQNIKPGTTRIAETDGMIMVYVPAGEFLMGSADDETNSYNDEKPQHKVYLDAFWIDRTEVTNQQYQRCVAAGACHQSYFADNASLNGDTHPVVGVSWDDAIAYCRWAGRSLPTEAQWEKAARGTDGRIYPWGNQTASCDYAVMLENGSGNCGQGNQSWPVGSKPQGASPYGALDMAGNVSEWTTSLHRSYPYDATDGREDVQSDNARIMRGGSRYDPVSLVRSAYRRIVLDSSRRTHLGFRCAQSIRDSGAQAPR